MRRLGWMCGAAVAVVAAGGSSGVREAAAMPTCAEPLRDRYEPGDEVTIVGYTDGCLPAGVVTSIDEERPLQGYLHRDPCDLVPAPDPTGPPVIPCRAGESRPPVEVADGIPVGAFTIEATDRPLRGRRMSLTFRLPADLTPGTYLVEACPDLCAAGDQAALSGYTSPTRLYVGVDPPGGHAEARTWPTDDPAIQHLPDDVLVHGPDGREITAAELRDILRTTPAETAEQVDATGATASDRDRRDDGAHRSDHTARWLVAAGLLAAVLVVATRLGPRRKQIRPKP